MSLLYKNNIQRYHLNIKSILEFINELEDAQAKDERVDNLITNANAMIIMEQFPRANKEWGDFNVT